MIRAEFGPKGSVRVSGSLDGPFLTSVLEQLGDGEAVLDLFDVSEADADAVRFLARLDSRYRLVDCPRWLALWIERERQLQPQVDGSQVRRSGAC